MTRRRVRTVLAGIVGLATAATLAGVGVAAAPATAASTCVSTTGSASGVPYDITVCLESPTGTVSGTTELTATATLNAPTTAEIDRMVFSTGTANSYLLADHDPPYRMVLDTTRYPNGSTTFSARPVFVGGAVPNRVSAQVAIDNPAPPPPDDETFAPWLGEPKEPGERFRLALVGDGVDRLTGVARCVGRHRGRAPGRLRLPR